MKKYATLFILVLVVLISQVCAQTLQFNEQIISNINDPAAAVLQETAFSGTSSGEALSNPSSPGKVTMVASPNPFTTRTVITCSVPAQGKLNLAIRNMFGETIKSFEINVEQEGCQVMEVTSENLRPGIYTAMLVFKTSDNVTMKTTRVVYTK